MASVDRMLVPKIAGRGVGVALWIALGLSMSVLALQLFLAVLPQERSERFEGPFASEHPGSRALVVHLNRESPVRFFFVSRGDTSSHPYRSGAQITANGLPLGPSHTIHESIRSGTATSGSFSHWNDYVLFTLPAELSDEAEIAIEVAYELAVHKVWVEAAQILAFVSIALLGLGYSIRSKSLFNSWADFAHEWIMRSAIAFGAFLFLLASLYFLCITVAWNDGWALPTTAVFFKVPLLRTLAEADPAIPHALLLFAMVGAILSWSASGNPDTATNVSARENKLTAQFSRAGLPIVLAWFLFSVAGTWAGIPRAADLSANAIAGLVPFSDANGHFTQTFEQVMTGNWNTFGSRRPLAAALRGAGMFASGYSNSTFILLQTMAIAAAAFFATRSVMALRGPWAGLTFLALTMVLVRAYLPTNLTEPLGILLALVSIPYFVRAVAVGSIAAKATGFLFTSLALTVRMGNMFAIPAIALWIVLTSGSVWRNRLMSVAATIGVIGLSVSLTTVLSIAFGSKSGEVGSNFSYTFCGLTHNADWTACERIYADELQGLEGGEAAVAAALYKFGLDKLISDPLMLATRLTTNVWSLVEAVPHIVLEGYTGTVPPFFPAIPWLIVVLVGFIRLARARLMSGHEVLFWVLFGVSMVASASVIFADDGIRVLSASYPLLFLLVSTALNTRSAQTGASVQRGTHNAYISYGTATFLAASIATSTISLPWLAHKRDVLGAKWLENIPLETGQDLYLSSRYMTGFLVIPDDDAPRRDVASIAYSDYRRIIENSRVESIEKISAPPPPFGLVVAPGLVANGGTLLVVPENVMTNQEAKGWKITYLEGSYFRRVEDAESISPQEMISGR
ncbi:MAG: hypothetical protein KKB61_18655 [Alphaproteobacteria bacterium]|nr:hypothetical protein [Alphaproteobacteria bacterium]